MTLLASCLALPPTMCLLKQTAKRLANETSRARPAACPCHQGNGHIS